MALVCHLSTHTLNRSAAFLPVSSPSLRWRVMGVLLLLSSFMAMVNLQSLFPSLSRFSYSVVVVFHGSIVLLHGQSPFCVRLSLLSGLCCFLLLGCSLYSLWLLQFHLPPAAVPLFSRVPLFGRVCSSSDSTGNGLLYSRHNGLVEVLNLPVQGLFLVTDTGCILVCEIRRAIPICLLRVRAWESFYCLWFVVTFPSWLSAVRVAFLNISLVQTLDHVM